MRIHHAVADGIALARVMLSLTDGAEHDGLVGPEPPRPPRSDVPALITHAAAIGRAAAGAGTSAAGAAFAAVRDPGVIRDTGARGLRDAGALAKLLLPGVETTDALKPGPGVAHRVAWSTPYDLWRVKAIGRAFDVTVNDVLVAAVSGALHRRMASRGSDVDEVHALVPFNLRPLDMPVPRDLGNRFGLVVLALPLGAADPAERLLTVKRRMADIKASDEGLIAYGILDAIGRTPSWAERRLIDYFTAKGSLVLTNVPGPRRRVRLAGVPVAGVLVWAPCSGSIEMSVSLFSYAGKVTVGFLVDAVLEPEPSTLAEAFREELATYGRLARRVTNG
jgi:diacylglycerol O-acyltransferase / wax synthase